MKIADLPLFRLLSSRMEHEMLRQGAISRNIANLDTPGYRPVAAIPFRELLAGDPVRHDSNSLLASDPRHIQGGGGHTGERLLSGYRPAPESSISGNRVSLELELAELARSQVQYSLAVNLYGKYITLARAALGKGV